MGDHVSTSHGLPRGLGLAGRLEQRGRPTDCRRGRRYEQDGGSVLSAGREDRVSEYVTGCFCTKLRLSDACGGLSRAAACRIILRPTDVQTNRELADEGRMKKVSQ